MKPVSLITFLLPLRIYLPVTTIVSLAKSLLACLLLLFLAACSKDNYSSIIPPAAEETRLHIDQGELIGFISENGAKVWRGIPYAEPPVGDLRWRAPRPPGVWNGVRQALEHPVWCTQLTGKLDKMYGLEEGHIVGNEDCLYLNVYAPSSPKTDDPIPVMMWVHGGSNTWGRIADYDGSVLAERFGLIVITVQYRLGPFGWLSHPLLRKDANREEDKAASFALLDLIAALKWIRANVKYFGGDASRVTIFGESAGAANVMALVSSSLTKGLFHRAIAQSGQPYSVDQTAVETGDTYIEKGSLAVMADLFEGQELTVKAMRALPVEDVVNAYTGEDNRLISPTMIADGVVLPKGHLEDILVSALKEREMPFIFGSNKDEAKFAYAFNPQFVDMQFGVFPKPKSKNLYGAVTDYTGYMWRTLGVDQLSRKIRNASVTGAYSYRFDWDEQGTYFLSDMSYQLGAAHSLEVPFVFGTFSGLGLLSDVSFRDDNKEGRLFVSDAMMSYWAEFAHNGTPGNGHSGAYLPWHSLSAGSPITTQVFDTKKGGGIKQDETVYNIESILTAVEHDSRLKSTSEYCIVAIELEKYFARLAPQIHSLKDTMCRASANR